MRKVIALLTDFGLEDNFVGIMKGVILRINPAARLVDLSHAIEPQNIREGALALQSAYRYFPRGTIFLAVVDPGVGSARAALIVKSKGYLFLGPDNGILAPVISDEGKVDVYSIANDRYFLKPVSRTFHGRDVFAPVAAHLSLGRHPRQFGRRLHNYRRLPIPEPRVDRGKGSISGEVIDVDRFGNLLTNIRETDLKPSRGKIVAVVKGRTIQGLSLSYAHAKRGELLAVIGSKGYLEISRNLGSAKDLLRTGIGQTVVVRWDR